MKPRRDNPDEDFDELDRDREADRLEAALDRADRETVNYPMRWFDAGEPS